MFHGLKNPQTQVVENLLKDHINSKVLSLIDGGITEKNVHAESVTVPQNYTETLFIPELQLSRLSPPQGNVKLI